MARSVSVFLRANVTGFVGGMRTAAASVGTLERRINASTGAQRAALTSVGRTASIVAVGLVAGFAVSVKAAMDFEKQMSAVKAATEASNKEITQLGKAALQAGKDTAYGATQAAKAETELAKAGVSVKDILGGGLTGALNLAAAGQLDVGEAAETAATAMAQFSLTGKDVPHIADLLAAGANKAQGEVHDLGYALKAGGLVAAQFGVSVDATVGTLAAFANAGLIGQDSGTSFKTMLLHLAKPSNQAADLMHQLGIETYDAQGKFIGITGLAGVLQAKLGGLTEAQRNNALATIFGTDAIRGANVLYKQGASGIQGWIDKTNQSGYAAQVAATKMDNLSGDLTKLKGSLNTALIEGGNGAVGALRGLTQAITSTVNAYASLPSGAQGAIFAVVGLTGAALLGAKAMLFLIGTVKDVKLALIAMGLTGEVVSAGLLRIRGAMAALFASNAALNSTVLGLGRALGFVGGVLTGPWGLAIIAAVGVLAAFSMGKKDATHATDEFVAAVNADSGALGTNTRAAIANRLEKEGLLAIAKALGISESLVTDAILGNGAALNQVNQVIDENIAKGKLKHDDSKQGRQDQMLQVFGTQQLRSALKDQNGELKASVDSAKRVSAATQQSTAAQLKAAPAVDAHTAAQQKLVDVMASATSNAKDLKDALDALSAANMTADEAAIKQRAAVDDATKASDKRRTFTDRERQSLIDIAKANQALIVAMKDAGAGPDELAAKQKRLGDQFIRTAVGMGRTRTEAGTLATRYAQLAQVTAGTGKSIDDYIGKVTSAAGAQQRLASRTGAGTNANNVYRGSLQASLPVLYALAGKSAAAKAQVDALASANGLATGATNTSRASFDAAAQSMGLTAGKANELWTALQKIKSRSIQVTVDALGKWQSTANAKANDAFGFATGGAVPSIGPNASRARDSVPAMLRVDEHVWTPEEVTAVGGHGAMYRMRAAALAGKVKGYAQGGAVSLSGGGTAAQVMKPIQAGYNSMIASIAQTFADALKKFAASGGPVVAAARSQIGLPYSWGGGGTGGPGYGIGRGAGTYGFDCSGLTEYAWWQGRHKDIGGTTDPQWANSTPISGPRPGALAFPSGPSVHVMLGSSKPGYVIQAPHTGAFVEEVPRTSSNWRWPTGLAKGGEVKLGELVTSGKGSHDQNLMAQVLQLAGSGPRRGEQHNAQIAPAGAMRLWAEPETGGEAYIPLASGKRTRSKTILAAVARRFGMSVQGMADGGITSFADGGIDTTLNLSDILSRWNDAVGSGSAQDVTDATTNKKTQAAQVTSAIAALKKAQQTRNDKIKAAERRLHTAEASKGSGRAGRIAAAEDALKKAKRTDTLTAATAKLKKERADLAAATSKLTAAEKAYAYTKERPTTQLGQALTLNIKNQGAFIKNLQTLADRGFGDLAKQLLAQGGPEGEKMAADAVKLSDSKLGTLQGQMKTSLTQQQILADMPNILTVRSAAKSLGAGSSSWKAMLTATGLDPGSLAAAVHLMSGDLSKTSSGQALLADMKAHGYATGGWIRGRGGADTIGIRATAGEYMIRKSQAVKYGPLIEAINNDQVGNAMLRRYIRGTQQGGVARGGDGASSGPVVHQTFHHQAMDTGRLAREVQREAAWALGS